jgi:hypothetical protein
MIMHVFSFYKIRYSVVFILWLYFSIKIEITKVYVPEGVSIYLLSIDIRLHPLRSSILRQSHLFGVF